MAYSSEPIQASGAGNNAALSTAPGAAPAAPGSAPTVDPEAVRALINQATGFNLFAVPDPPIQYSNFGNGESSFATTETLHRFEVKLNAPTPRSVQAINTVGEAVGNMDLQWFVIPDDFMARPDRQPPAIPLDPRVSQRFVMQQMTFTFGDGTDGFRSFGTGRTFPMMVGNQPRVIVCAVGNVTEGFGQFQNHDGNYTICGDLTANGFQGDILVRFQDQDVSLRSEEPLPLIQPQTNPDPQTTYFLFTGQKGQEQGGVDNHFSLGPDKQVRGIDITTQLRSVNLDFAVPGRFQGKNFTVSKNMIGTEIGFGRGSIPTAPPAGTPLSPYMFEGVAQYTFSDNKGRPVGAILTNVIEGRRFDMRLVGAPGDQAWRFGFFGPIIYGTGCFEGAEGMFFGSSGSVFYSLPQGQIVTHFYMVRLNDPDGKFRANNGAGWF